MSEWHKTLLGKIVEITNGYAFKSINFSNVFSEGSLPVVKIRNVANGDVNLDNVQYHKTDKKLSKYISVKGDILIAMTGNHPQALTQVVGAVSKQKINQQLYINQRVAKISSLPTLSIDDFIYYYLKDESVHEYLANQSSGSANQANISKSDIENLELFIPCVQEQKAIASVLSSLDDKIDLLHRQNKTLESMAETLFRQWFVEEVQDDWEEVKVSHFVTLNKSSITKKYDHQSILYLDTSSLTKGYISELKPLILSEAPSRAKRLVQHLDILISTVRPDQCHYGFCFKPEANLVVSTGFCTITCDTITPYFVYYLLTSEDMTEYLHSIAEGSTSTYPSLKPEDIGNVSFALPPKEKLNDYHNVVGAMWNKINQNQKQIQTLENLRDTLLPKLMSGEVRVNYTPEEIKQ
ncbi:type I restriction-modification system, specificity subunit S [Proteus hauseri ATCC 700826]|uniref:Type I restriction-modification system, specificity subunit S n=1 Tax=Proteus hauseri ATCC 700826 TaxID=1354271 RepID=A0AAJ3HQM7_PROHU|nr:restriction endonuclease subunit S [Proteus hauseri]OAT45536.1 type I restriction-modification system, specificity subunit S [Proteus hauseri ATCC 700826]